MPSFSQAILDLLTEMRDLREGPLDVGGFTLDVSDIGTPETGAKLHFAAQDYLTAFWSGRLLGLIGE